MKLNHINIKAPRVAIEQEKKFLIAVLGLHEGERPFAYSTGYWLYNAQHEAIIHMSINEEKTLVGEVIDHIAFSVQQLTPFEERLHEQNIEYQVHTIATLQMKQIFFYTPLGVKIELNSIIN